MNTDVKNILDQTQIEQRSDEWFNIRKNMLTASDVAAALGINKYQSQNSLIKKKINTENTNNNSSKATEHGNKYEDEARLLFSKRYNLETWEIGLFQHPKISWLGGSPDGIASDGNLIEIKCPVTREIYHEIPDYYYPQVQICMEILERPACYFIQYKPMNDFQNGIMDIKIIKRSKDWFHNNFGTLSLFWKKVLYCRNNGYTKFNPEKIIDLTKLTFEGINNTLSDAESENEIESDNEI